MNLRFADQVFIDVNVPLLWGTHALIAHPNGEISSIDLNENIVRWEVVKGIPWTGVEYSQQEDGFVIHKSGSPAYFISPSRKLVRDLVGTLPECQILDDRIRIGTNTIKGGTIGGAQVGIGVTDKGFFMAGPLPPGLAKLTAE